jgi:hydroxyacylglutathione hydrolase
MPNDNYILDSIEVGFLQTNCYLFAERKSNRAIIFDPGDEAQKIINRITEKNINPEAIIITHGHADHIGALDQIAEHYKIPFYIHEQDIEYLTDPQKNCSECTGGALVTEGTCKAVVEGDIIKLGDLKLKIIHTPGHTPGCMCVETEGLLFTGDTLFCGCVGRWDLPGGDAHTLKRSLRKFEQFPGETIILPGHGPRCALSREFEHNPYLLGYSPLI